MSVEIPSEFTPFVASLVASGRFSSESEVIARALRLLQAATASEVELQRELQIGEDELARGECYPAHEVIGRLNAHVNATNRAKVFDCRPSRTNTEVNR